MYVLVLSNNLIILFIGWEGVGIMSYFLINYWFNILNANKSSLKAILFNKIGDIFFIFGLILCITFF